MARAIGNAASISKAYAASISAREKFVFWRVLYVRWRVIYVIIIIISEFIIVKVRVETNQTHVFLR